MYCNINISDDFALISNNELYEINGGVNWAIAGGVVAIVACAAGCAVAAVIGFGIGGPAGAGAAAFACAKETAPIWLGGIASIALGCSTKN